MLFKLNQFGVDQEADKSTNYTTEAKIAQNREKISTNADLEWIIFIFRDGKDKFCPNNYKIIYTTHKGTIGK